MIRSFPTRNILLLLLCLLSGLLLLPSSTPTRAADSRQVFSGETHEWLRAVGKLQVPGQRNHAGHRKHYKEDCSATLVALTGRTRADTIVTAWHCLEIYDDLSKPITFTLVTETGVPLTREAYRLADGGGMDADWAILRLHRAVSAREVPALGLHPQAADISRPVTMAGYSGDSELGNNGLALTFDASCTIFRQEDGVGDTNCSAYKGASGGVVIQLSPEREPLVCGVISQGNGEGRSTFVPVSEFRSAINRYLK